MGEKKRKKNKTKPNKSKWEINKRCIRGGAWGWEEGKKNFLTFGAHSREAISGSRSARGFSSLS